MSFARATFGAMRTARTSIGGARAQLVRLSVRRGYSSSQGSNASKPRTNLQWAVGATAVTIPICWYLLKSTPPEAHHLRLPHKPEDVEERPKEEAPKKSSQKRSRYLPDTDEKPTRSSQDNQVREPKDTAEDGEPQDKAAASKPPGDSTTQSGKQEKLSNDDTKHSRDIGKDSPLSQKGEDTPESSKSKGTVDTGKPEK